jgi:hypothetical protein
MNFTEKIEALIVEIEKELGVEPAFPVTLELAKASLAARKLEAVPITIQHEGPPCGIDCQYQCARGYRTSDACFDNGRKWPKLEAEVKPMERVAEFLEAGR